MFFSHGGDITSYELKYGRKPLDFSANVSMLGMPETVRKAVIDSLDDASAYPDPHCRNLRSAIAEHENIDFEWVLCGNGAADLIDRFCRVLKPKKALLPVPCFSEYEKSLARVNCELEYFYLKRENNFLFDINFINNIHKDIDLVVLCNPCNPTGHTIPQETLLSVLRSCQKNGSWLMVDECFVDFLNDPEIHTLTRKIKESEKLIIFKAFTKFYGMAGLRLGYCMCADKNLLFKMSNEGQPWPVSSIAQIAGAAALADTAYRNKVRETTKEERHYLTKSLLDLGQKVIGGEANFIFFSSCIQNLCQQLQASGILIRDCSNFTGLDEGYYRIAVKTHDENVSLIEAIKNLKRKNQNE